MSLNDLWVEEFRPRSIEDYVWCDDRQKQQITDWLRKGAIPHLLLTGSPGTGKSSLSKVIFNELKVDPADVLIINASDDNGVDVLRDKIGNFVKTMSFGGELRYVLLDEADYLTINAQSILRNMIESYSHVARFILTANYPHKIMEALHGRCQGFSIKSLNKDDYKYRILQILAAKEVEADEDTIDTYITAYYPDLRKTINSIQQNSSTGKLLSPTSETKNNNDVYLAIIDYFRKGNIKEARKLLIGSLQPEEIENLYVFMYQNLELFGDTNDQDEAVLIIKQALIDHTIIADPEINLSATIVKLSKISTS